MSTIAHIGSAAAVHVGRFEIGCGEAKVGEFDDDFAFLGTVWGGGPTICDDKVFRLDVTVEYLLGVTGSDCVAHLCEHGGDEAEASAGEKLCWVKC